MARKKHWHMIYLKCQHFLLDTLRRVFNALVYIILWEKYLYGQRPLPEHINLRVVLDKIEMMPAAYFRYVDAVKIGTFPEMIIENSTQCIAMSLYISNFQASKKICMMMSSMRWSTLLRITTEN